MNCLRIKLVVQAKHSSTLLSSSSDLLPVYFDFVCGDVFAFQLFKLSLYAIMDYNHKNKLSS